MTVLEKIGVYVGIPSGIVTILEYLEKIDAIKYFKNNLAWVPLQIKSLLIWIYENVILLEVNIWILLLTIILLNRIIHFIKAEGSNPEFVDEEKPVDLLEIFNKLSDYEKKAFHFVMYCEDTHKNCDEESFYRHLEHQVHIRKLEAEEVIKGLVDNGIIEHHYNMLHGTAYTLTEYGRKIAITLIKNQKKVQESEGS